MKTFDVVLIGIMSHFDASIEYPQQMSLPGCAVQSVMILTADSGVASSNSFIEIDHEIISKATLLLPMIQV